MGDVGSYNEIMIDEVYSIYVLYMNTMSRYIGTGLSSQSFQTLLQQTVHVLSTEDMHHLLTQAKARLHAYLKAQPPWKGMEETPWESRPKIWVTCHMCLLTKAPFLLSSCCK